MIHFLAQKLFKPTRINHTNRKLKRETTVTKNNDHKNVRGSEMYIKSSKSQISEKIGVSSSLHLC